MAEELVAVGRIAKPHGIRGEVAVDVLSDVPGRLGVGVEVHVAGRPARIVTSRPHQGRLLIRFEHVTDRTAAELLRGHEITAPPVDLTDEETYYAHELVGLPVVDEAGDGHGQVSDLIELPHTAGYDLLEVTRRDGSTWLLPASDGLVEVEDPGDGPRRLRLIDPPEGLTDPDRAEMTPPSDALDPADEPTGEEPGR